jgi:MFS family permease
MPSSIAQPDLHRKLVVFSALAGLFFGLMPPYVLTIVVVATWGVPPLEAPADQAFRAVYFLRLVLGNVIGLTVGAGAAAAAANFGLTFAGKATYLRGAIGGAILGGLVGAVSAGSCPLVLLISSTNREWAWIMIERSFLIGGCMGLTNGLAAGLVIVYLVRRYNASNSTEP